MNTRVNNTPTPFNGDGFVYDAQMAMTPYELSTGECLEADLLIVCTGSARRVGNLVAAVDEHNFVKVDPDLQIQGMPKVFCIGDANNLRENKLLINAQFHAALAVKNIYKLENNQPTDTYTVRDYSMIVVPIGPYKGAGAVGSYIVGDFLTSQTLGKGLFTNRIWGGFGLSVPDL